MRGIPSRFTFHASRLTFHAGGCLAKRQFGEGVGIDTSTVEADTPVKVRARGATRGPDLSNGLPTSHRLPFPHENFRQVEVHRMEAEPVINEKTLTGKEVLDD